MKSKCLLKKICFISLGLLTCIGVSCFCQKQTAGFTIAKVQDNFCLTPLEKTFSLSTTEQEDLQALLKTPFTYLGRGKQSFVFQSPDEKYVLKIFNNHYQTRIFFLKLALPFFSHWAEPKLSYNLKKLQNTFSSYSIAFEKLKEHTALLYVHLEPTDTLHQPLVIVDKLGIQHRLSADKTAFLIQKKASLVYPTLLKLKEKNDHQTAETYIKSLLDLLVLRYQEGLADNDPLIRTNFGFIENRAVQIDVGPFSEEPNMKLPSSYVKEVYRITASLKNWLENNYPELIPFLDHQLVEMLNSPA